jgi:putative SOS response-associated peptidase YedK
MCGRYALKLLAGVLDLPFVEESAHPQLELPWEHYNVCPGTVAPIVDKHGVLRPALWGLIPHWSKEPPKRPLFNARLETAPERSSFRTAWQSQRCVVPTSGFYEWSDSSGTRQPYFIPPESDGSLLWLAGLAARSTTPQGEPGWTYAVLTKGSNGTPVEGYHDRIPVMLTPDRVSAWLHGADPPAGLHPIGQPYRVSARVNVAAVNEPSNLKPEGPADEQSLGL